MPELELLFLQMLVILVAARLAASAFRIVGQPGVVGEMAAGLLLGPSLLGRVFPAVMNSLFPADGLGPLYALSQVGLVLFMFLVVSKSAQAQSADLPVRWPSPARPAFSRPLSRAVFWPSIFIHASETAPLGCRLSCSSEPPWGSLRFRC